MYYYSLIGTHSSIERLTDIAENDLSPCETPTLTNELCLQVTNQEPPYNEHDNPAEEETTPPKETTPPNETMPPKIPEALEKDSLVNGDDDTGEGTIPDNDHLSISTLATEDSATITRHRNQQPLYGDVHSGEEESITDHKISEDDDYFCAIDSRLKEESCLFHPRIIRGRSDATVTNTATTDTTESLFAASSNSMWREIDQVESSPSPDHRQLHQSLPPATYLSVSSSTNSVEDSTHRPSESDSDSEDGTRRLNKHDSIAVPDYYSLIDDLVETSRQEPHRYASVRNRSDALVSYRPHVLESATMDTHSADIWVSIPQPSHQSITSLSLSASSLWITNNRNMVYWTHPTSGGRDWQVLKKHMSFVSSSYNGVIVWGVYQHQAFARQGISDINPMGVSWKKITGKRTVAQSIKWVSCDQTSVWAITTDSKVLFRNGISDTRPEGTAWLEVETPPTFFQIVSCKNIVWALDVSGRTYVRTGINPARRYGVEWQSVKPPSCLASISVVSSGVVWGIGSNNRVWFKCGASTHQPEGGGHWWEVTVGSINSKPTSSNWKVLSVERSNSILHQVTSFINSSMQQAFMGLSACSQSGVCLMSDDNQLHACWKVATGYYNDKVVVSDKMFGMSVWVELGLSDFVPWLVRDDRELFCIISKDKVERISCPGEVTVLSCSPSAVWVVTKNQIWSRQGMCTELPQGISWDYIELGTPMQDLRIVNLAIGKTVVWALDHLGCVHFRFGVHPREPGTGMAPAWIPVDDYPNSTPHHFIKIAVSPDNSLIWVLDQDKQCYVRKGVTEDFPVGRSWEHIAGEQINELASACGRVFGVASLGDLLCRQGITETNPGGNYWRRLPGKFRNIATTPGGELWLTDDRGTVLKQQSKVISVCQATGLIDKAELEMSMTVNDWEVI